MAKVVSCLASPSCPGYEPPPGGRGLSPRGSSDRDWGSQSEEDGRGVRRARGEGVATPVGMDGYDDRVSARGGREKRGPALGWTKRNPPSSSSSFRVDDYARLLSNYRRIIMIDGYRWVDNVGREDFWDLLFFGVA